MVKFQYKAPTWGQRKELFREIEKYGGLQRVAETKVIPIDFVEKAFVFCLGYDNAEDLNKLDFAELNEGAALVFQKLMEQQEHKKK